MGEIIEKVKALTERYVARPKLSAKEFTAFAIGAVEKRYKLGYPVAKWLATGAAGPYFIDRMEVTPEDAMRETLRAYRAGLDRVMVPGVITRLVERTPHDPERNGIVWMSDTADEWKDHEEAVSRAHGQVLVHGLGIGMVAAAMLKKDSVDRLTIIERSEYITALVEPSLRAAPFVRDQSRLRIILADAYEWVPEDGTVFDTVWSDIWPHISADNVPGYVRIRSLLHRVAKWHGCWVEKESRERLEVTSALEALRDEMKRMPDCAAREELRLHGLLLLKVTGALDAYMERV